MRAWMIVVAALCLSRGAEAVARSDIETRTLGNGLRVILARDSRAGSVHLAAWYRVGSRDEKAGHTGMAALMERLMARGSAKLAPGEYQRRIVATGGGTRSVTTSDYTLFQETVPRERLELALQLEADRMANLRLDAEELRAQRDLMAAIHRQRTRNPAQRGLDRLYETAFTRHPYRTSVFGRAEDLEAITLEECREFYRSHYSPANAVITLSGDFDPKEASRLVEKSFGAVPKRPAARRAVVEEPPQHGERRGQDRAQTAVPLLLVGWHAPADSSADAAALEILGSLLARGASSRLSQRLVSGTDLCYRVEGGFEGRREPGLFYFVAGLKPQASHEAVEKALVEEVERLAQEEVLGQELEKGRVQGETALLLNWETAAGRGQAIGQGAARFDDPWTASRRLERLRAVSPADLRRVASTYLRSEARTVVWILPEGEEGTE